jgi:GDP-L-fucose synthase
MKILVTGGTGMIGSAFRNLETPHELILVGSKDYDLKNKNAVDQMLSEIKPDTIIHLASRVGGVKANTDYVNDFFYDNIAMNTNILELAKDHKISKVLSLLSTCVYPDNPNYPLTEEQVHSGEPHKSNFGYAYAKRMLEVHSRAIRRQHGLKYITAIPNNVYGENDNFDLDNGHVIPSMIRKFYEAKISDKEVFLWGDGSPLREFTLSSDIAKALLLLLENYDGESPVNIGHNDQRSIRQVANIISEYIGFRGEIVWDSKMPTGQQKKPSSNKKFLDMFPEFCYTNIEKGLEKTCKWFVEKYPNVRGVK